VRTLGHNALLNEPVIDGLAFALQIKRRDGNVEAFADVLEDTVVDGVTYSPGAMIVLGSITIAMDDQPTSVDMELIAQDGVDYIFTQSDLHDGLYNGSEISLFVFNRNNLAIAPDLIFWGDVGEIKAYNLGHVEFTVIGPLGRAKNYVNELYGGPCRAIFTDARCKVDPETVTFHGAVLTGGDGRFITVTGPSAATGNYNLGLLRFTSGRLKGRAREIRTSTHNGDGSTTIELYIGFGVSYDVGDICDVRQGCSYDLSETGCPRYNNILNYRGEPYIDSEPPVTEEWTT
jgi:uncharacterized phage protein (TIGR02218 family)